MLTAWILDVYPIRGGMCLWMVDENGRAFPCWDEWAPVLYLKATPSDHFAVKRLLEGFRSPFTLDIVEKKDFFTDRAGPVIQIRLTDPLLYSAVAGRLMTVPDLQLFNADLNLAQAYFYERDLFPLARCQLEIGSDGRLIQIHVEDSPWAVEYPLPPLRFAHLSLDSQVDPNHRKKGTFVLTLGRHAGEGVSYVLDGTENDLLMSLNRRMAAWDPDILLTDWGDSFLLPRLELYSRRTEIPLRFSRDPEKFAPAAAARSYFSYGRMVFKAGQRTLFGRLHIDTRNSFTFDHTDLEGLIEIARVAKIPIQRAARSSIGTALSSMQHNWAIQHDYLIPLDKGQTEDFHPAEDLMASDRGGLVYEPEIGWHEDVLEFDFSSMYPEIMIRHNVTPEAINCECCPDNSVPEIHHHICRHRIGMIPAVLTPLVAKRRRYKELIQNNHPQKVVFKRRSDAFKWALVTCFGYLGFRNARFGRIEAHECVNAYSREALLKAKEIAEEEGFRFLHAIVDSLWLKKPGMKDEEVEALRRKIEKATGLPLGYEGRYRWVRFSRSRQNPLVGVPNRYFGAFVTGEIKVRGIELRRHDTPLFIKQIQSKLLEEMSAARSLSDLFLRRSQLERDVEEMRDRIRTGQVTPLELAISVQLRQEPGQYVHDTLSAIAAKKLAASGVALNPGETIQFVVVSEHDAVKDWRVTPLALIDDTFEYDHAYYERMLDRAVGSVLFFPVRREELGSRIPKPTRADPQLVFPGL